MTEKTSLIQFVCSLDKQGYGKLLSSKADNFPPPADAKDINFMWYHVNAGAPNCREFLKNLGLDNWVIQALTAQDTRPRFEMTDHGYMVILRGVNLNPDADLDDMISVRCWVQGDKVITVGRRSLKSIADIVADIESPQSLFTHPTHLMIRIIRRLGERMSEPLLKIEETVDSIEESIMHETSHAMRSQIKENRSLILTLRRYIAPQRDAVNTMLSYDIFFNDHEQFQQLKIAHDYFVRFVEDLDLMRDRLQVMMEEVMNNLSEKMNRNLYVLSIISMVFLPLGFLTGLLGINIAGMPGTENQDAFWIFSGVLAVLVIIELILFKKMKWI